MASPDAGYFSFELDELKLFAPACPSEDFKVRVDAEIIGSNSIKWTKNNSSVTGTDVVVPFQQKAEAPSEPSSEEDEPGEHPPPVDNSVIYILGFNGFYRRSTYLDLTGDSISELANASVVVKVLSIRETAPPPPAKGSKAPVDPTPIIVEELLAELVIPLSVLVGAPGNSIQGTYSFNGIADPTLGGLQASIKKDFLLGDKSSISIRIAADDDFAEYVLGGSLFFWRGAVVRNLPVVWNLHSPDVPDPKAKVQPTEAEYRRRYLDNIAKLLTTQEKLAAYSLVVGGVGKTSVGGGSIPVDINNANNDGSGDETREPEAPVTLQALLPVFKLSQGEIEFDAATAEAAEVSENIRERRDLWTVRWGRSQSFFIHRSKLRKVVDIMRSGPDATILNATLTKTPTAEGAAHEGSTPLSISLQINVAQLMNGATAFTAPVVRFVRDAAEEAAYANSNAGGAAAGAAVTGDDPQVKIAVAVTSPLQPPTPIIGKTGIKPADLITFRQLAPVDAGRDVMRELRNEITTVVKLIAHEYINQYPPGSAPTSIPGSAHGSIPGSPNNFGGSSSPSGGFNAPASPAAGGGRERAAAAAEAIAFLHYLSSSGVYHQLKEKLKPKIQRAAREKYGPRGQALGKSDVAAAAAAVDVDGNSSSSSSSTTPGIDKIVAEMYVLLVKECNTVLNELYTTTLIDRDAKEIDVSTAIDDEKETPVQIFRRLLNQADDAEADGRPAAAEQLHLERIQVAAHDPSLGSEPATVHGAYARYGEFCLRVAAKYSSLAKLSGQTADSSITAIDSGLLEAEGYKAVLLSEQNQSSSLVSIAKGFLAKGREALEIAFAAKYDEWRVGLLLAAVLVECGLQERAESVFAVVIDAQLEWCGDNNKGGMSSIEEFDGYESDKLSPVQPVCYAVLAGYFSLTQQHLRARKALLLANRSFLEGNFQPPVATHGIPRRTIVLALSQASQLLFDHGCPTLGKECLSLGKVSDEAVTQKAAAKGGRADTIPFVRHLLKRSECLALLAGAPAVSQATSYVSVSAAASAGTGAGAAQPSAQDGDDNYPVPDNTKKNLLAAVEKARESLSAATSAEDTTQGWLYLARTLTLSGSPIDLIIEAYAHALEISKASHDLLSKIPLEAYISAGRLFLAAGKLDEAFSYLMTGCRVHSSATLFLLVGITCLRLERFDDAEDALQEANLLDNRNSSVWAYLSILCLAHGPHRLPEAEAALAQALRLKITDSSLLRELATSFMASDKLQVAEDLVRRAIALEISQSQAVTGAGRASSLTRKLLGDILATENQVVLAVDEYQRVIADSDADVETRLAAAGKCAKLLSTLGRDEDLRTLKQIIGSLNNSSSSSIAARAQVMQ